jgi:hypothetical protein
MCVCVCIYIYIVFSILWFLWFCEDMFKHELESGPGWSKSCKGFSETLVPVFRAALTEMLIAAIHLLMYLILRMHSFSVSYQHNF